MVRTLVRGCALAGLMAQALLASPAGAADAQCNRACLEKFVDQYLSAMLRHDPSRLPVTPDVKYVENNQAMKLGEGTWKTVSEFGAYRHYIADPQSSQVVVVTIGKDNGAGMLFDLRLKIDGNRISEAESMVIHDARGHANYMKLGRPADLWLQSVPASQRVSRAELAALPDRYLSAMQNNDGKGDYSFFADNCDRLEHGLKTTNNKPQNYGHSSDSDFVTMSCLQQFATGFLGFVTRVRDRRHLVIDEERQVAFTFSSLDHNGTIRNIMQTTGVNFHIPPYFSVPRTLQVGEVFKAENGRIRFIEMTLNEFPYGMRPLFDPGTEPLPLSETAGYRSSAKPSSEPCDRGCLETLAQQLLRAMMARDSARVPMASAVKYTENDQQLNVGDGMWGTLTEVGDYRVFVADPKSGEVGFFGRITELDIEGILSMRLKVVDRQITEIEAVVAREEIPGSDTLFRPKLLIEPTPRSMVNANPSFSRPVNRRMPREQMVALANGYFDAMLGRGGDVPFAATCDRWQNGIRTTNNASLPGKPPAKPPGAGTMWAPPQDATSAAIDPSKPDFKPFSLGCAAQLRTGFHKYIEDIRDRRQWVVDEERGLVFMTVYSDIPGSIRSVDVPSVGRITYPKILGRPYTLVSPHVFKIEDGTIKLIDTLDRAVPYRMRSAWARN